MSNIGDGDVPIVLGEHEFVLKPTLKAAMTLSRGGLIDLVKRCADLDFEAIQSVIVAGIGKRSKDIPGLIFESGLLALSEPCIRFVHILANGGKPFDDEQETAGKKQNDSL